MKKKSRRFGGAILEAALVLPILLSLGFGAIEFGYYFSIKNTLQGAARAGARTAIIAGSTNQGVLNAVSAAMTAAGLQDTNYTVAIRDAGTQAPLDISAAPTGEPIQVTISCDWGSAGISPLGLIASDKSVTGATVMLRE